MLVTLRSLSLSVYLPTLLLSFCQGLLLPVLPVFAASFGASYSLIGLVLAGEALGMLLADVPAGALLRRLGRKWTMLLGIIILGAAVLALAWAASVVQVLGLRLLAGVGDALWNISRHAYLTEATRSGERGRAIALFGGTNRLGLFLAPAVGGGVATAWGLSAPFILFAGVAVVAVVAVALFTERTGAPVRVVSSAGHASLGHLATILRSQGRVLLMAGAGQLLAQVIRASRQILIPLIGAGVLGLDLRAVGLVMSISGFVDLAMFLPAGLIMDRWGRKWAIVPCFALQGLGMLLLPFAAGALGLVLVSSLIGFGNGLGSGSMMTLGSDLAPQEGLGEFLGLWRLIGDGGSLGAPLAVGAIADVLSLSVAALVMAGVGLTAAAVFAFGVPETLRR